MHLSKDTVRALGRIRMATNIPGYPFDFRAIPAAVFIVVGGATMAFHTSAFDGHPASPPVVPPVLVTILDRDPEPEVDNPRQTGAIPGERRVAGTPAEVPPPPARCLANAELPALEFQPLRHVGPLAMVVPTQTWGDSPGVAKVPTGHTVRPAADGDVGMYWQVVRRLIAAKAVYPPTAVRRNAAGQVVLRLRIGARGELVQTVLATSSGEVTLDRAALSAVREAAPFPVPDLGRDANTNGCEALIPVRFELVDGAASR